MKTKFLITLVSLFLFTTCAFSQNKAVGKANQTRARQILDKTAQVVANRGGAQANFTMAVSGVGKVSGTIMIKGNKFFASTPDAKTWFNGKTQWTYLTASEEVNITNPTPDQQARMNPYKFISIYKTGYNMSYAVQGNEYKIHLKSTRRAQSIQEMIITVNKQTYVPSNIRIREGNKWSTISIRNFKKTQLPDARFTFNSKDFPRAEVIDLR